MQELLKSNGYVMFDINWYDSNWYESKLDPIMQAEYIIGF